ncbi:hypothetical protein [Arcticibacter sp.]|uniref:hypothetical protein n=1 Tax=Arcticibacter sp. TaxID=1872630 RepID=UPI00388FC254
MNIIQGRPKKFKQTAESMKSATEFGLSSSTAGVIRSAFEPAYLYRDGTAAARCTQAVYRSIRGSLTGFKGQRDLHDGDLSWLRGMEFNIKSKLSEVLQVNHQVSRNEQGQIVVSLGAIAAKTAIRLPAWLQQQASRYRIRFSLIGFNFRREYYEYLEFRDVEISRHETIEAQQMVFQTELPKDQILLLSMTLMAYKGMLADQESALLNSREFSPSALIAAFAAEEAAEFPGEPMDQALTGIPELRWPNVVLIGYEGNRLIRELGKKIRSKAKTGVPESSAQGNRKSIPKIRPDSGSPEDLTGKRVSFGKR